MAGYDYSEGDRVEGWVQAWRPAFGKVTTPKTRYGRVEVLWDDMDVEDTHMLPSELSHVKPEEEVKTIAQHVQEMLDNHGLTYTISSKDGEVLAQSN